MAVQKKISTVARRWVKTSVASLATMALVATGFVVTVAPAQAAGDVDGTVSGRVVQTFSSEGWYSLDGEAASGITRARPVANVTVTAYDAVGDAVGTTTSGADGTYSLPATDALSNDLRVEFSDWPEQYEPGFAAQGTQPAWADGANDTSVQFVTLAGSPAAATGVDFGLIIPDQVIQPDAPIATAIMYAGDPQRVQQGNPNYAPDQLSTIVAQPWSKTGSSDNPNHFDQRAELANFKQVGSVYGLSYNRTKNFFLSSAVIKRMAGLGPLGLGGIYAAEDALAANGQVRAGATMAPWFALDTDLGINVGSIGSNADRGLTQPQNPARDIPGFEKSARAGMGSIATTLDGNTLFVTNLNDQKIYSVDISAGYPTKPTTFTSFDTPAGSNQQIWALLVHSDRLYVGYVDTGASPGASAATANMKAYVRSIPVTAAVAGTPGTWRDELTMDLGYNKGSNLVGWGGNNTTFNKQNKPQLWQWNSWTDLWSWQGGSVGFNSNWGYTHAYPQPILSGLAIDIDGYLNLGFLDRTDLQSGQMNWAADTTSPDNRFFESVTGGDTLVASPVAISGQNQTGVCESTGEYRIECNGKIGDRAVRTTPAGPHVDGTQWLTYNNNQGPATGEFFNDVQNMGRGYAPGSGLNGDDGSDIHFENTLGSVMTYPGIDEVGVTAIDPGPGVYRSGIMWFDQRDGTATRYFDQVDGVKDIANPAFEKGGGLGAIALLGVAAPVEIGNRVWLDADLNGRQDADEPAINGAVVEIYEKNADGSRGALIGTRVTQTIDGQGGTYYFRSDDAYVATDPANPNKPALVRNADYELVFKPGASLTLVGPNADHAGFADLTWADLQLTAPEVRTDGTTAVNDSNPTPDAAGASTGSYDITVGGPGENNHTYDAGFFGKRTYTLEKKFNPEDVKIAPGSVFGFDVVKATNFRGESRLDASGGTPGDPEVNEKELTVSLATDWGWESEQELPFGYTLVFEEVLPIGASVTWNDPVGEGGSQGRLVVAPSTSETPRAVITATNNYGKFIVNKTVTGTGANRVADTVKFKIEYQIGDATPQVEWVSVAEPFALSTDQLTPGTTVKVREVDPIETNPVVVGVSWGDPAWTLPDGASGPDEDGWISFDIPAADATEKTVTLGLNNVANERVGGFSVLKSRAAGEPLPSQQFAFEYKVGVDAASQSLGSAAAGTTLTSPATIPYGSTVLVREVAPTNLPNVTWAPPAWSGLPAGATGPDADGWVSFTLTPQSDGAVLPLTATNKATELFGQFTVEKTVDVTEGDPQVAGWEFNLEYRTAPAPGDGVNPVFGAPTSVTLTDGEVTNPIANLPFGTIVQVREILPTDEEGAAWGAPSWTINDTETSPADGWVQFTINGTTNVALVVTNPVEETYGSFTLAKRFDGTGIPLVESAEFPVEVIIGDAPVQTVNLSGDGTAWDAAGELSIGTVVKVKEVTPLPVIDGIEWDEAGIEWSGTTFTTDDDGFTVFEITSDGAALNLIVTNKPTQLFGGFEIAKTLTTSGNPELPADYTFEYTLNGADATQVSVGAGESVKLENLPYGTDVEIREVDFAQSPGDEWTLTWTIDGNTVEPDADGWISFEITDQTIIKAAALNDARQKFGSFDIAKTVIGDGADLVPEGTEFWFEYILGDGTAQLTKAVKGGTSEPIVGLPIGTVVTITEVQFPDITGIDFDQNPVWSIGGEKVDAPVTFTITDETRVTAAAENTATRVYGSFEVSKQLSGAAADRVPEDARFIVEYSTDAGETWTALPGLAADGVAVSSPQLLVGTDVILREQALTGGTDYEWGTPQFTVGDESASDSAEFTIEEAEQQIDVLLTNPVVELNGSFVVEKRSTGVALTDPSLSAQVFTVEWSGGGREGQIELDADGSWSGAPGGAPFPVGTVITLTEAEVTGLGPDVEFVEYSWASGPGIEVSADGKTATLTVALGEPAELVVTNEFRALSGSFAVEKVVDGDFSLDDPELVDQVFTVAYTASTGESGTLELSDSTDWKAELVEALPAGTTVTLTEVAVSQAGLPPHVKWDGYTWLPGEGYSVSEDGLQASLTVEADAVAQLQVQNSFSKVDGSFLVQKLVDGDFEITDPEIAGLEFTVDYTSDDGSTGSLVLNRENGWVAASDSLPNGSVVELTEVTPTGLPAGVDFDGYAWVAGAGVTVSADGKTATITVNDTTPVSLSLTNTFTALLGGFGVEKSVAGDVSLEDPLFDAVAFAVDYTSSDAQSGTLLLNRAGEWTASTGAVFPVGTVVTLTEGDVADLPEWLSWDGYAWLAGDGYTVSEDGLTATVTIAEDALPALALENTFSKLAGGFAVTKQVSGEGADLVPGDLAFAVEYSLDNGSTWVALPALTLDAPLVAGPSDLPLGTDVLIREVAPASVPGVEWGSPAFSGTGVVPGTAGAPASFVISEADVTLDVLLTNPTTPTNGQFQVTKKITGGGSTLVTGDPLFTVTYTWEGLDAPEKLTVKADQFASSVPIPAGTVVTILEVAPVGALVAGASWGDPVFVTDAGTVLENGSQITVVADTVLTLVLENPTKPPLPPTGSSFPWLALLLGVLVVGAGGLLVVRGIRRRGTSA